MFSRFTEIGRLFNPINSTLIPWVVTQFIHDSACDQQSQDRFEPNTLLAHERYSVDFSTIIAVGPGKSQANDLSRPGVFPMKGRMLLGGRFSLPLAAGTAIAANGIKERTTAVQLAIVQNDDVDIGDAYTVQHRRGDFIKPVPNHDCIARAIGSVRRTLEVNRRQEAS
jgi:hypothetical protein